MMATCWTRIGRKTGMTAQALVAILVGGAVLLSIIQDHRRTTGFVGWTDGVHPLQRSPRRGAETLAALFEFLERPQPCCRRLQAFGGDGKLDGDKQMCMDAAVRPPPGRCLVYSIGTSDDFSFDSAVAEYGCEVHCFDPTVARADASRLHFGGWFHRLGLGGENTTTGGGWRLDSVSGMRRQLGHSARRLDYLKIDAEGSEWSWLASEEASFFRDVPQIALEIHLFDLMVAAGEDQGAAAGGFYFETLQFLYDQGYCLASSRPNAVKPGTTLVKALGKEKDMLYEILLVKVREPTVTDKWN